MKDQFTIDFNEDTLTVFANPETEWTMPSALVARGYGVSPEVIRGHKANHDDELLEGKHWITVQNSNGGSALTWWTKRGVIRLGMFIRSDRAKKFRDFCEDLVITEIAKEPKRTVDPITLALEAALETRKDVIELVTRTEALEQRLGDEALRSTEIGKIYRLGQHLGKLMGGHDKAWRSFKDRFQLASYRDLPRREFENGVKFLEHQIVAWGGTLPGVAGEKAA
jgi:hypothetical protein